METENFTSIDVQKRCPGCLLALRVAATAVLLLCAFWCGQRYQDLKAAERLMDETSSFVKGGKGALPQLTAIAFQWGLYACGFAVLLAFSAVAYVWVAAHSISRIAFPTALSVAVSLIVGQLLSMAVAEYHAAVLKFGAESVW